MQSINLIFKVMMISTLALTPLVTTGLSKSINNATLEVDTTLDSNVAAYQICSDAPADCTLRGAISKINADPYQSYSIQIPGKEYVFSLSGRKEDENAYGDLDIHRNITIMGAEAGTTIINGNTFDRIFHIHSGAIVEFSDLTIKNGKTAYGETPAGDAGPGGGIYNAGQLTLGNVAVAENNTGEGGVGNLTNASGGAGGDGGGIYNAGMLEIFDSVIVDNSAGDGGDALPVGPWDYVPTLDDGGPGGSGGGIYNAGNLTLIRTTLTDNSAGVGGRFGTAWKSNSNGGPGGAGGGVYTSGSLISMDSQISNNTAGNGGFGMGPGGDGGGVFIASGKTWLHENTINGNQSGLGETGIYTFNGFEIGAAGGSAGGVYNAGTLSITDSTVAGNSTGDGGQGSGQGGMGGGIYNRGGFTLVNTAVRDNTTGNGGIYDESSDKDGGQGGDGGGLYNTGTMLITDSPIDNNLTGSGADGSDPFISGGNGGSGGGIFNTNILSVTYSSVISNSTGTGGIYGGSGGNGGGLFNIGSLTLTYSTLESNSTGLGGDGQACSKVGQSSHGGGIYNAGDLDLLGVSVLDNLTGAAGSCDLWTPSWLFRAVWGSSSSDVFAVGWYGAILHYDGSTWSLMESGTDESLFGVWGSSASDVFAVGGSGTILHYDGSTWSLMDSGMDEWFGGVWGSSASDVFAVGGNGTILNYDGSTWSAMTTGSEDRIEGVWGSSASDVFAVGGIGTILHYDGISWSRLTIDSDSRLEGVWGSSANDIYAVGGSGTIQHFDGSNWSSITPPTFPRLGGSGGGLYLDDGEQVALDSMLVAGNQIASNGYGSGLFVSDSSGTMLHTTLASNSGGDGSGIYAHNSNIQLQNTILVSHTVGITATTSSAFTLETTLWGEGDWANGTDFGGTGQINHTDDLNGDPGFKAPKLGDYHLTSGSDAIDQGTDTGLAADFDDQPRPNPDTNRPDLGADEVWTFSPIGEVSISGPITGTAYTHLTFSASITPDTATPNIHYVWIPMPKTGQGTDTGVYRWFDSGDKTIIVTAKNADSSATAKVNVSIAAASFEYFFPVIFK